MWLKIWIIDLQRSPFSGHDWVPHIQGVAGTKNKFVTALFVCDRFKTSQIECSPTLKAKRERYLNRKPVDVISAGLDRGKLFPEVWHCADNFHTKALVPLAKMAKWQASRSHHRRLVSSDCPAGELHLTRRWAPRVKTQVKKTATLNFNLLHLTGLVVRWYWPFFLRLELC